MAPLPRSFYERPTLQVARELLGMWLCLDDAPGGARTGRIVEVEAYLGLEDRASHARLRKAAGGQKVPTERSALLFGPSGFSYVYLIYGLHHCFNAVAHDEGGVGAVLVRALEPGEGLAGCNLAGPARLCAVLGIDRRHNGLNLCQQQALYIDDRGTPVAEASVARTPRIGVDYAGEDASRPYRLCDRTSAHLSRRLPAPSPRPQK